jgi:hypothetical protein
MPSDPKIDKIIKLLALTQSPNDAEALSAMRMANAKLTEMKLDWAAFLKVYLAMAERRMTKVPHARTTKYQFDTVLRLIDLACMRYQMSETHHRWVINFLKGTEQELIKQKSITVIAFDCLSRLISCGTYQDYDDVHNEYEGVISGTPLG